MVSYIWTVMAGETRDGPGGGAARGETALQQLGHKETQRPFFSCRGSSGAVRGSYPLTLLFYCYYSNCLDSQHTEESENERGSKDGVKNLVESEEPPEQLALRACIPRKCAAWTHYKWAGGNACMHGHHFSWGRESMCMHHLSDVPKRPNLTCCPLDACLMAYCIFLPHNHPCYLFYYHHYYIFRIQESLGIYKRISYIKKCFFCSIYNSIVWHK